MQDYAFTLVNLGQNDIHVKKVIKVKFHIPFLLSYLLYMRDLFLARLINSCTRKNSELLRCFVSNLNLGG